MNKITIVGMISSNASPFHLQASSFHTTRVLERRRRTQWDSGGRGWRGSSKRSSYYNRRDRKLNSKRQLLRNVSSFAEELFQSWQCSHDDYDPSESHSSSWFREFKHDGYQGGRSRKKGRQAWSRNYQFFVDDDDFEVENVFRSAFGRNGYSFYSFINDYRACALKWHPDRHSGSAKAKAEEKFKLCSAAYQSLCDKLALN